MHPHLKFDLLRAQYEACKDLGIKVPIYLTAGVNNMAATAHPEWRQSGPDGRFTGWAASNIDAGFFYMCFNTGYLEFLCEQLREVVRLFPDNDGIFLDIITQPQCVCHACITSMHEKGLDPLLEDDRKAHSRLVLESYYRATTSAVRSHRPDTPIFHNSGHITRGDRNILEYFSHLELESLPTGGWGYDHFPISAKYCANLPHDVLGMTGKFHTTWGEFGGIKHPNALRYECAQMLAVGAKCSVGDQLHPRGKLDASTYQVIGEAFRDVEAKEPWCENVQQVADIGVISCAAINSGASRDPAADIGAGRILLEGHFLFDVLDEEMDFGGRKALLLPDEVQVGEALKARIDDFLSKGGKLILSGRSGLHPNGDAFLWDLGAEYCGVSPFQPDYVFPEEGFRPEFVQSPFVMYLPSQRIRVTNGSSLGKVYDPYFNRSYNHFSSHQHAPNRPDPNGYAAGVMTDQILYFAHPVFSNYRAYGAVVYRQALTLALRQFLDGQETVRSNLPSTARLHLNYQDAENRYVLHLLYANTILRGSTAKMEGGNIRGTQAIEVVEELLPLRNITLEVRLPIPIRRVRLEPQGVDLSFETLSESIRFEVEEFTCHQMVSLEHE
jgi:hypothetical protein